MAKYWIMPHDMDKITAYNQQLASQVKLYENYDVSNPEVNVHYDNTKELRGAVIYIGEFRYLVSYPQENGFVVKRDWSAPDEIDPVLKAWGNYDDVDMFRNRDDTFVSWFDRAYVRVSNVGHKADVKWTLRIRCFAPRRSKRFSPKITMYQSARDRFEREREVAMKPARAFAMMFPELEHKQIIELTDDYLNRFAKRELFIRRAQMPKILSKPTHGRKPLLTTSAPLINVSLVHHHVCGMSSSTCLYIQSQHTQVVTSRYYGQKMQTVRSHLVVWFVSCLTDNTKAVRYMVCQSKQ